MMNMHDMLDKLSKEIGVKTGIDLNVPEIMNKEMGQEVDYIVWTKIVEMQKEFNNSVAPGWQTDVNNKKYDFWMAVLDETVEVLGSRHWKWWKGSEELGKVDWNNVQVELIDIFHFVLSLAIQNGLENILYTQMVSQEMIKHTDGVYSNQEVKSDEFFDEFWFGFLSSVQMKILPTVCVRLIEFWYKTGKDANDLFREYFIKAALNSIRQKYGYGKQSSYIKMWTDENGNKVEDNVIAWKLAEGMDMSPDFFDEITNELDKYYLTNVAL